MYLDLIALSRNNLLEKRIVEIQCIVSNNIRGILIM